MPDFAVCSFLASCVGTCRKIPPAEKDTLRAILQVEGVVEALKPPRAAAYLPATGTQYGTGRTSTVYWVLCNLPV